MHILARHSERGEISSPSRAFGKMKSLLAFVLRYVPRSERIA
jgi:hypothetical protein